MLSVLEPLLLFWLIFLPGVSLPSEDFQMLPFDVTEEILRVFLYDLPAFVLILLFAFRSRAPSSIGFAKPGLADAAVSGVVLAVIALIALGGGYLSSLLDPAFESSTVYPPNDIPTWIALLLGCVATGYLEETYFRAYLLTRLKELGVANLPAIATSVALFALCHIYEGPWGALNAVLAGLVFSLAYRFRRSVHGPAWAHAAYNALVYASAL
jgi:membrane protease YdiL (CAAX protease family)